MSARDKIIKAIREVQLTEVALSLPRRSNVVNEDHLNQFTNVLERIGGRVNIKDSEEELESVIEKEYGSYKTVNGIEYQKGYNLENYTSCGAEELDDVDVVILRGDLSVAENGAVWLSEHSIKNRLLPFICKELVLVIEAKNMVADMHQAYERIGVENDGYGVFIAGPSKTADIEQSLVIGAHGPLALSVFIIVKG